MSDRVIGATFCLSNNISVCVISGIKRHFLLAMDEADFTCIYPIPSPLQHKTTSSSHFAGSYCGVVIWTTADLHTAVISACLPTLRPLVQYTTPIFTSINSTIKSIEFSGHAAKGSDESYMLSHKERDVFQLLPESTDGHTGAREPANSKFVSATVIQVGPERGDRF